MFCSVPPWTNAYVTTVALHPTRPTAFVATRRPHSYVTEMSLASCPASIVGAPLPLVYSATQLFVVHTDAGADRLVVVTEDRIVDVYSWQSGGALLFRHVPRSKTLSEASLRIAMADVRGSVLYMVPLLRSVGNRGTTATEALPPTKLYYATEHPETILQDPQSGKTTPTRPSTRVYFLDCFDANAQNKKTNYIENGTPVVGLRVHPGGGCVPILAVLCADSALRLYDLSDAPVLYNVVVLSEHCRNLQLPTFSRLWVNGDGRSKVFDFVPTPLIRDTTGGNEGKKKRSRIYSSLLIAVAESTKVAVFDVSTPGSCEERFFASAPPHVEYLGILCGPIGSHYCSGAASADEHLAAPGTTTSADAAGSRRLLWIITSQGFLEPLTMDDEISAETKILIPAEWVPRLPLFQWAPSLGAASGYSGAKSLDRLTLAEGYTAMYGTAGVTETSVAMKGDVRDADLEPFHGMEVVAEWSSLDILANHRSVNDSKGLTPLSLLRGKALRLHLIMHPRLPYFVVMTPVEGTWSCRRLPLRSLLGRRVVKLSSVATSFAPPGSALKASLIAGHDPSTEPVVCVAPPFAFVADARSGVSTVRILALDASLVDDGASLKEKPVSSLRADSLLLCEIIERGQTALVGVEQVPLSHLGDLTSLSHIDAYCAAARYVLVAVTYAVTLAQRTMLNTAASRLRTVLLVVDQSMLVPSVATRATKQMQPPPEPVAGCRCAPAVRLVKIVVDAAAASVACRETCHPLLLLHTEGRRGNSWIALELTRLTPSHVDGSATLANVSDMQLQPPAYAFLDTEGCNVACLIEDTPSVRLENIARFSQRRPGGQQGPSANPPPLAVGFSASRSVIAVSSRSTRHSSAAAVADIGHPASLFPCPAVLLAATVCAADDILIAVVVTADQRLSAVVFDPEDPTTGTRRHRFTASTVRLRPNEVPSKILFLDALAICESIDGIVRCFSVCGPRIELRALLTLPFGSMLTAVSADRVVAISSCDVSHRQDRASSSCAAPPVLVLGHCSVPFLGHLLAARIDLAASRLVQVTEDKDDVSSIATQLTEMIAALVAHLPAQAEFITLGVLCALSRIGLHSLIADIVDAQYNNSGADGAGVCLTVQPYALRSVARITLPQDQRVFAFSRTEQLSSWPIAPADAFLLYADRARQFTALLHRQNTAGALVLTAESATPSLPPPPSGQASSSATLGVPAAHAALQKLAWATTNERGHYPTDMLIFVVAHLSVALLPEEMATAVKCTLFNDDVSVYRAYRVVCSAFGAASAATRQFVTNANVVRQNKLPNIVRLHHARATESGAKAACSASPIIAMRRRVRERFLSVMRAKGSDVRLGRSQNGMLGTVAFPMTRTAPGDDECATVPYGHLRLLLTRSALPLWSQATTAASNTAGDSEENEFTAQLVGGTTGTAGDEGGGANRSSTGEASTGVREKARPQPTPAPLTSDAHSSAPDDAVVEDALARPSEASIAAAQQRALRERFLKPTVSDSSSDDGTVGPRIQIKLRELAAPVVQQAQAAAPSLTTGMLSAVPVTTKAGNRRIGGGGGATAAVGGAVSERDVDDVLAAGFAAVEALSFASALAEFDAAAKLLESDARLGNASEQARLRLVAHYRVLCKLQVFFEGDTAAASVSPREALMALVHCVHLRVAHEHLSLCLREVLRQVLFLRWATTSRNLVLIIRSFQPELLDTHQGQELLKAVEDLPVEGAPTDSDDAAVTEALHRWCMCGATFKIETTDEGIASLVACPFCEIRFGLLYLAANVNANTRLVLCPACGVGQMAMEESVSKRLEGVTHPSPSSLPAAPGPSAGLPAAAGPSAGHPAAAQPPPAGGHFQASQLEQLFGFDSPAVPSAGQPQHSDPVTAAPRTTTTSSASYNVDDFFA